MPEDTPKESNPPVNSTEPKDESADRADVPESTDDYFERVNQRLKTKKKEKSGKFGLGKSSKKASEPKETPPQMSAAENKTEFSPKETPEQIEQLPSEKSAPLIDEVPAEEMPPAETSPEIPVPVEQQPSAEITEPQPTIKTIEQPLPTELPAETIPIVAEAESVPQPVEEAKPKKKSFFGIFSLHKKPKELPADKLSSAEGINELPPIQSSQVEGQLPPVGSEGVTKENIPVIPSETLPASPAEATSVVQTVNAPAETQPEKASAAQEAVSVVPIVEYSDGVEDIAKYAKHLQPEPAKRAVVCLGEYPIHLLLKSRFAGKSEDILPLFIDKSSHDIVEWSQAKLNPQYIIGLDSELDTHFWYNIVPNVSSDSAFISRLKNKPIEKLQHAIIIASVWDGVGSALLPTLISQFNEWKINSVALALLPSKLQPLESQFNAFSAVGKCTTMNSATLVLLARDSLESYIGVDRRGHLLDGNVVANYLLDFMLSKETLVEELSELSKTFDSKLFTLLFGTGNSLKIYGSIENILDIALNKVFLTFDISSSSLVYVLVRMPYSLKEKLTRGKVEMAVANWFKDKADLKSIHVAEPVYVEDANDRIDIALFIGGFDVAKIFSSVEKKVNAMKNQAVKNGFIKEAEWKEIVKNLTE
jgi:hypothetical protein